MAIELIQKDQKQAEPKTYKIGQSFKKSSNGEPHILVSADVSKVLLVSVLDGRRYGTPVKVGDSACITEAEFAAITQGMSCKFIQADYKLTEI